MNCVIYSRVSTTDQDNERQIHELKEYIEYKKYKLLGVFEEKVSGASKAADRIEFSKMIAKTGSLDHIKPVIITL